ncbi:hypothetical protein EDC04DRAFT_2610023 [Pisolithus marmoratus]|nr:hypothetical protein EDC04DRAFT_2610023 [Pisolithus marmoratus]
MSDYYGQNGHFSTHGQPNQTGPSANYHPTSHPTSLPSFHGRNILDNNAYYQYTSPNDIQLSRSPLKLSAGPIDNIHSPVDSGDGCWTQQSLLGGHSGREIGYLTGPHDNTEGVLTPQLPDALSYMPQLYPAQWDTMAHPQAINQQRQNAHKENTAPSISNTEGSKLVVGCKRTQKAVKAEGLGKRALETLLDTAGKWSNEETWSLLDALLGPDSTVYDLLMTYPKAAFKKVAEKTFDGHRTFESVKGRYERLRKVFTQILTYESFTGNGDGDADTEDFDGRIEKARQAGKAVGDLNGTVLKVWYEKGWYTLFNNRLGNHPGLSHERECHSGQISDADIVNLESESGVDGGESDPDETSATSKAPPAKKMKLETAAVSMKSKGKGTTVCKPLTGVPEPRHKKTSSRTGLGSEVAHFLATNVSYLETTAKAENERLELLKKQEDRESQNQEFRRGKEQREVELAEIDAKVRNAREILVMEQMPEDLKMAARNVLMKYLMN